MSSFRFAPAWPLRAKTCLPTASRRARVKARELARVAAALPVWAGGALLIDVRIKILEASV
jgi:hypothetical protein